MAAAPESAGTGKGGTLIDWIDQRFPLTALWRSQVAEYYAPKNFNFWYYFGSLALLVLVNQLVCSIACITFFRQPENKDAWNTWTTGVFPVLSVGAMGYVLYLLWHNLSAIGGGGVDFVQAIPWICIAWMALGLILALVMKARSPQKYEVLGRMVNTGIE